MKNEIERITEKLKAHRWDLACLTAAERAILVAAGKEAK